MLNDLPRLEKQQGDQASPSSLAPAGLVVFSPTMQLLYQNRQAQYLSGLIKASTPASGSPLTKAFQDLSEEILTGLQRHPSSMQPIEKKCVMVIDPFTILFQGIGIPHKQKFSESRIIIRFSTKKQVTERRGS